jgi:hypothetical protein
MSIRLFNSAGGYIDLESGGNGSTANVFTFPAASGVIDRLNRAGNVLQVVQTTTSNKTNSTSTSYVDVSGMSLSITPTSATSKILVIVTINAQVYVNASNQFRQINFRIVRDSTAVATFEGAQRTVASASSNGYLYVLGTVPINHLDSPSTTSAITYKIQASINSGLNDTNFNINDATSSASTITLMEIAA